MKKFEWIFFDLDGTLADSLDVMYNVYIEFLKYYDIEGNQYEFKELIGPSINQIVIFLKKKYNLKTSKTELIQKYQSIIKKLYYNKVQPTKGSSLLLKKLFLKNYNLALVTSSPREIAENFLIQNNWMKYFSIIVSGDDVKFAKPHPAIYKLCISMTGADRKKVLVFEDSKNGLESAKNAGLKCIMLDGKKMNLNSILEIC